MFPNYQFPLIPQQLRFKGHLNFGRSRKGATQDLRKKTSMQLKVKGEKIEYKKIEHEKKERKLKVTPKGSSINDVTTLGGGGIKDFLTILNSCHTL